MAPSDHSQEPAPGSSKVPALISDYRAQRDAWLTQARDLAQLREQVVAAAGREARDIVAAARDDVRRILLKARRDLLVLTAQVQAATEGTTDPAPENDPAHTTQAQSDDLHVARAAFVSARHDVRRVLDDARPDLEALSAEAAALRSGLRDSQPSTRHDLLSPTVTTIDLELPATDLEMPAAEHPAVPRRETRSMARSLRAFVAMFVLVGLAALIGTRWWLSRPTGGGGAPPVQNTVESAPARTTPVPAASAVDTAPEVPRAEIPEALSVTIDIRRMAWIRTTVDGRVTSARLFEAGETQNIAGAREVIIRAGDAGAVFVSVNGGTANALGRDGEVITRHFALKETRSQLNPMSPPVRDDDAGLVTNERPSQEQPIPPPAPTSGGADAQPQAGALGVNTPRAPPTIAVVPPVIAPEPPPGNSAAGALSLREEFVQAAERWFDAYYRRDSNAMAAVSEAQLSVSDERTDNERLPQGLARVRRSFEDVNLQVLGESAIFTGRMTERWEDIATARMAVSESFVSQIWTRRAGAWRLTDVRIFGAARVNRTLR